MDETEIRKCLMKLDEDYYTRMEKVLTLTQMMEEIFARSFKRALEGQCMLEIKILLSNPKELAAEYEKRCMKLG